jgi:hypothetical protein
MSLNFGLYLVEQGVISCDQFCGLIKVQQMAVPSPASVAIRSNLLTVRHVGQILNLMELNPGRTFIEAARSLGLLGADGQQRLEQEQQKLLPSIPFLLVECGLLSSRQVETLQQAFERSTSAPASAVQVSPDPVPTGPSAERVVAKSAGDSTADRRIHPAQAIRQPKFIQHPQVGSFEEAYYG